jgi:D-lactate dehydrogenase (cytochrome)
MRENILGLQCVLPNGTIAKCGTKALKSSAGYDLVSLMTGSEGTLGVITHVTVRLHAIPDNVIAATCTFETIHDAAEAVSIMRLSGVSIDRCEILDESSIMAFLKYNGEAHNAMSIQPTLFLEFSGPSNIAVEENVNVTKSICNEYNGLDFKFTANDEERKELWKARHTLYYASIALRSGATGAIVTDACVPLSQFANIISKTVEDVKRLEVIGPCFGHAGDGNFHCILPICDDDQHEYIDKLHEINHNLIQRTIEVGGTCTGEHGVGYGKIKYLKNQYGEGGVEMMKMVKVGLDPNNIMNPGKVVLV